MGLPPKDPTGFGIEFDLDPSSPPILAQAVIGVLSDAAWETYTDLGTAPETEKDSYVHEYTENRAQRLCFKVTLQLQSARHPRGGLYLTNRRIAETIFLLGFDLAHRIDLTALTEYNFRLVHDEAGHQVVVGNGTLRNGGEGNGLDNEPSSMSCSIESPVNVN